MTTLKTENAFIRVAFHKPDKFANLELFQEKCNLSFNTEKSKETITIWNGVYLNKHWNGCTFKAYQAHECMDVIGLVGWHRIAQGVYNLLFSKQERAAFLHASERLGFDTSPVIN